MSYLEQLAAIVDPQALCYRVGKRLNFDPSNCDHTFKHTRAFLETHARAAGKDVDEVLDLLRAMGATCDCELGLNICADLEED